MAAEWRPTESLPSGWRDQQRALMGDLGGLGAAFRVHHELQQRLVQEQSVA